MIDYVEGELPVALSETGLRNKLAEFTCNHVPYSRRCNNACGNNRCAARNWECRSRQSDAYRKFRAELHRQVLASVWRKQSESNQGAIHLT